MVPPPVTLSTSGFAPSSAVNVNFSEIDEPDAFKIYSEVSQMDLAKSVSEFEFNQPKREASFRVVIPAPQIEAFVVFLGVLKQKYAPNSKPNIRVKDAGSNF
jgi:hypothetical protein